MIYLLDTLKYVSISMQVNNYITCQGRTVFLLFNNNNKRDVSIVCVCVYFANKIKV